MNSELKIKTWFDLYSNIRYYYFPFAGFNYLLTASSEFIDSFVGSRIGFEELLKEFSRICNWEEATIQELDQNFETSTGRLILEFEKQTDVIIAKFGISTPQGMVRAEVVCP